MNIPEPAIALRPRNGAEAIDLGLRIAQQHFPLLVAGQSVLILPTYLLLSLLLPDSGVWVWFLLWWLKPLFERLSLQILSHRLFGIDLNLRQALKLWCQTCLHGLPGDLLWRRLRLSRSYHQPLLLEGLNAAGRRKRRRELGSSGAARWLTLFGVHLEGMLSLSVPLMLLFFAPGIWPESIQGWLELIEKLGTTPWLDEASNLLYALTLVFWGPFYSAAGMSLYMNRRCEREAWDLELVFRRLASRLTAPLVLGLALCLLVLPPQALADKNIANNPASPPAQTCPLPASAEQSFDETLLETPRLTSQPLNSQQARQAIQQMKAEPPYTNIEEHYEWGEPDTPSLQGAQKVRAPAWLGIALETLLWSALLAGVLLLIWRYREWLRLFAGNLLGRQGADDDDFAEHQQLDQRVLPAGELEARLRELWQRDPREALALFYRNLLAELERRNGEPLGIARTEGDVQRLIERRQPRLQAFSRQLIAARLQTAYGHQQPEAALLDRLLDLWQQLERRPA